ncbi:dnaJ homolog subfamily B member 14-like [Bombus pyrosoma]|uniref:dnaJ homolog subfamily B member 14-like n=1 Tax=Bombus pyrosoma TaxID=396416 RepID=UPI001CB9A4BC|nr:dnaJ homolog subfamily B member 14-like [Bombus pyrosoma]
MAQIFRVYKFEVPTLIHVFYRNYNHQRRKYNYYEVLHISSNATQKEIRDAYIKLSKQMHPDCGNKGNHDEFVKINEAYSILSNKQSKRSYDIDLKQNNIRENYYYQNARSTNHHQYAYDMYYSTHRRKPSEAEKRKAIIFWTFLLIVGLIIQVTRVIVWSNVSQNAALRKSGKIMLEVENSNKKYENKTLEEKLEMLEKMMAERVASTDDK